MDQNTNELERRVAALEQQVAQLQRQRAQGKDWLQKVSGSFEG